MLILAALLPAFAQDVPLLFSVTDARGSYVVDLTEQDFQVFENGRPQDGIVAFRRESGLPLRLGILIDTRDSRPAFEKQVHEFFRNVLTKDDKAFLVGFDTSSDLIVDFTGDVDALAGGVRKIHPGNGAVLYDAVFYACWDKLQAFPPDQFRRALVVVSNGQDTESRVKLEQALEIAHRTQVVVFSISTAGSNLALDQLTDQSGGFSSKSFEKIADELQHQSFLLYIPKPFVADGQFHKVEIRPRDHNLRVRTRMGYYAPSR